MKSFYNCVRSLFAIAENTIRDAVRQRFFSAVLILALLLVVSGLFFQEFDFGASELKFIADFGFGTVLFFGSILTIVATTQVYFGEFDSRAVMTVLAKPMHRSVFMAGKFLGMSLIVFHSHPTGCGETPFRAGLKKGGRRRIPTKESAV